MSLLGKIGSSATFGLAGEDEVDSLIPGIGDAKAIDKSNKQNIALARENREWSERMSNTAYERAMADMKKAGLNPMLAYQQGGASVPNVAAATTEAASKTGLADAAMGAFTGISAAQTQRQQAVTAQAQSQSTISLQGAQTANTLATQEKTRAETLKIIDSIKNQKVRRELENAQIPLAKIKESAADVARNALKPLENLGSVFIKSSAKPKNPESTKRTYDYLLNSMKPHFGGKK